MQIIPSLEVRLQSSGKQWLDSVRKLHNRLVRKSLLQHGQRPQPQAVFRKRTKTRRSLSYPNQLKTLGMRRIGEPLHCSATLARLGQKHQFVHLCQQLEKEQAHANLACSLEEMQQPSWKTCRRDSSTRTTKQAAAAVSLQGFVRPGESIRHHSEGWTVGSGLRCREVERTVSGAGGRSRRHVLHHSKQSRKACCQSPHHDGSMTGKR